MEITAVDQSKLLRTLVPVNRGQAVVMRHPRLLDRMRAGASFVLRAFGDETWPAAVGWQSDVARGWAAMAVGLVPTLSLEERLQLARRFAVDHHFGVREWAWLGVRGHIANDITTAIAVLKQFAQDESPFARRFASEATRPIGVWSKHIPLLRRDPSIAHPLLTALISDSAPYVQVSLGNWLNDASRDNPEWVLQVCDDWSLRAESPNVYRRAVRTLVRRVETS
jgi:3-methyladenine DNA glycosylase AlkC